MCTRACARLLSLSGAWAGLGQGLGPGLGQRCSAWAGIGLGLGEACAELGLCWEGLGLKELEQAIGTTMHLSSPCESLPTCCPTTHNKKSCHATNFLQVDEGLFQHASQIFLTLPVSLCRPRSRKKLCYAHERTYFHGLRSSPNSLPVGFTERKKVCTWACLRLLGLGRSLGGAWVGRGRGLVRASATLASSYP